MSKLVRDKIPEIIQQDGRIPVTRIAEGQEFSQKLNEKLREEVNEFLASGQEEELADILEVVYTLAHQQNISPQQLEHRRKKKAEQRGGFQKKIILEKIK